MRCYVHETRGVFLTLGSELRYNTADSARAKARSYALCTHAVYDADVGFIRLHMATALHGYYQKPMRVKGPKERNRTEICHAHEPGRPSPVW